MNLPEFMTPDAHYSVRGVKTWEAREGYGFNCTILRDGKKIGTAHNAGDGGCIDIEMPKADFKKLLEHANACSDDKSDFMNEEILVQKLVWDMKDKTRFKRMCAKNVVYVREDGIIFSFKMQGGLHGLKEYEPVHKVVLHTLSKKMKGQKVIILNAAFCGIDQEHFAGNILGGT